MYGKHVDFFWCKTWIYSSEQYRVYTYTLAIRATGYKAATATPAAAAAAVGLAPASEKRNV